MLLTRQPAEGRSLSSVASCTAWWQMGHATCWETETERTSRKQRFFFGSRIPCSNLVSPQHDMGLLKSWGNPKSSMGWGWTIWICLISLLSGLGTCPHSPSPNYWGYTYFFKWCSNSPQKGHLPSSKWNRPCQIGVGRLISFHQTWFIFTLYSNLPAYQPLMILSKSIDLSAGPVSTADAIAATTRSGARGLEKPSSRESDMRTKG